MESRQRIIDQSTPLLGGSPQQEGQARLARIARKLYISHFLSTWNSRVFEFGSVLYLAAIYPGTLLPMSTYAMARGLSAILFAPAIGQYIDKGNRLQVVRVSIVFQRLAIAASCLVLYVLTIRKPPGPGGDVGMLALLSALACIENLCSIMNMVSVEKDWVVVVAGNEQEVLWALNAQMRRIDLLCKLFGPLFIALMDGISTQTAIIVNFAMNAASVGVEYFAIARVYRSVPELQEPKNNAHEEITDAEWLQRPDADRSSENWFTHNWKHALNLGKKSVADFALYFRHRAFLPSIAGALLYLTVLSFAGQLVTYLLSAGYKTTQIGVARTLSVCMEVAATWVAPWLMGKIGPVRAGLWFGSWQVAMLVAGTAVFWLSSGSSNMSASGLVSGVILSRVGLRGFDLCAQLVVQQDVEADNRGVFSSVEAAWQNAFELLSYASTMVFSRPEQFRWPTLISVAAVSCASLVYTVFVYIRRGHLLHLSGLTKFLATTAGRQRERDRAIERIVQGRDV